MAGRYCHYAGTVDSYVTHFMNPWRHSLLDSVRKPLFTEILSQYLYCYKHYTFYRSGQVLPLYRKIWQLSDPCFESATSQYFGLSLTNCTDSNLVSVSLVINNKTTRVAGRYCHSTGTTDSYGTRFLNPCRHIFLVLVQLSRLTAISLCYLWLLTFSFYSGWKVLPFHWTADSTLCGQLYVSITSRLVV